MPTASAYCQARRKVKAEVFQQLNAQVRTDFYRLWDAKGKVKRWRGHRLVGAGGSYLNLPDSPPLRERFSAPGNQYSAQEGENVQALAVVLCDLLNEIGLRGALGAAHSAEKSLLFNELWTELEDGDVLVLDRNSSDYTIIGQCVRDGRDVVARCSRRSFKAVMDFFASPERERMVT